MGFDNGCDGESYAMAMYFPDLMMDDKQIIHSLNGLPLFIGHQILAIKKKISPKLTRACTFSVSHNSKFLPH
jgi:hypothetical protein